MSLTARELTGHDEDARDDADGPWVSPVRTVDDVIVVTCAACGTHQAASGRAGGYTCESCGTEWGVLRCRACRRASVVLAGTTECAHCGHDRAEARAVEPARPRWLTEPDPLSVWIGGVRYLGGHADRDQPLTSAGLLLDRRGIHLRAFKELLSMPWSSVRGIAIEGPADISERLTVSRLHELGAQTWAVQVAYLTVSTEDGDAIFEVDGLGPPELHARLSRVLQGLQRSEHPPAPIVLERPTPVTVPAPVPVEATLEAPFDAPFETPFETPFEAPFEPPAPVAFGETPDPWPTAPDIAPIDPATSDAPLEVLVVDALWKLARVREAGLLDDEQTAILRAQLIARVPGLTAAAPAVGPLLRV